MGKAAYLMVHFHLTVDCTMKDDTIIPPPYDRNDGLVIYRITLTIEKSALKSVSFEEIFERIERS